MRQSMNQEEKTCELDYKSYYDKHRAEIAHLEMKPGMFAVFFPGDAHWGKVQSAAAGLSSVRKVCVKIAADTL